MFMLCVWVYLTLQRLPVKLTDAPSAGWSAQSKWTPEFFKQHAHQMHYAHSNADPLFLYSKADDPKAAKFGRWKPSSRKISTDSASFFNTCERNAHSSTSAEYLSYTGPVKDESGAVVTDLQPIAPFFVGGEASRNTVNVWMGCKGVTTHTHYDMSHNLYVQLFGRKRFILFPPGAASALYLFPKSHPSHRSSQVPNFLNISLLDHPRVKRCLGPVQLSDDMAGSLECTVGMDGRVTLVGR